MPEKFKKISKNSIRRKSEYVVFGDVIYPPGGSLGPRVQEDYQIFILNDGFASIKIDGQDHFMKPGQVLLLKPGHRECFQFSKQHYTHHQWCSVSPHIIEEHFRKFLDHAEARQTLTRTMRSLFEIGLASGNGEKIMEKDFLDQLGLCTLRAFMISEQNTSDAPSLHNSLRRARAYIQANIASPLDIPTLASLVGVSSSHLTRLFKTNLGITPARYIWDARVEKGAEWLRDSGLSIGEISEYVGFENQFHFSRLFKNKYKCAPLAYRNKSWKRGRK